STRKSQAFRSNRGTMPKSSLGHLRTSRCPGGRDRSATIMSRPLGFSNINGCAGHAPPIFPPQETSRSRSKLETEFPGENGRVECPDKGLITGPIFPATAKVLEDYVTHHICGVAATTITLVPS